MLGSNALASKSHFHANSDLRLAEEAENRYSPITRSHTLKPVIVNDRKITEINMETLFAYRRRRVLKIIKERLRVEGWKRSYFKTLHCLNKTTSERP